MWFPRQLCRGWLATGFVLTTGLLRADALPPEVPEALAGFATDAPPGWAYTVTTRRGAEPSVERYDPAEPGGRQWQLLQHNGRAPTEEERDKYGRYRVTTNATTSRASFHRADLDLGTARQVGQADGQDEYLCGFRADVEDPLLHHLELHFWIAHQPLRISRYTLHLLEGYSPIVGLKIQRLEVAVALSPPGDGRPALPLRSQSLFHGRLLLFTSVDEEIEVDYSDFEPRLEKANPG